MSFPGLSSLVHQSFYVADTAELPFVLSNDEPSPAGKLISRTGGKVKSTMRLVSRAGIALENEIDSLGS